MDPLPSPTQLSAGPRYYKPTEHAGPGLWIWLPVVGGISAILLGTIYAFLNYLIVQIIESPAWLVVVIPFFAAGLVATSRWVSHLGNARGDRLRQRITWCVAGMGFYATWHIYLNFASDRNIFDPLPSWHMSPLRLVHAMLDLADNRGWSSWFWWLVEAASLYAFVALLMGEYDPQEPFCEQCGRWTKTAFTFELADKLHGRVVEEFERQDVTNLQTVGKRNHGTSSYLQVRVLECPCGNSRFACLERVTIKPGKKGGVRFGAVSPGERPRLWFDFGSGTSNEIKPIVLNLAITPQMQQELAAVELNLLKTKAEDPKPVHRPPRHHT